MYIFIYIYIVYVIEHIVFNCIYIMIFIYSIHNASPSTTAVPNDALLHLLLDVWLSTRGRHHLAGHGNGGTGDCTVQSFSTVVFVTGE